MMPTMITMPYVTVSQAAKKLGVSRQRMHKLLDIYGLRREFLTTRMVLIPVEELKKIPRKRTVSTRIKKKSKNSG